MLITADALSGEVVRTVTELALRHRYLILKVPFGGEELCRRLRREYGVSIVLNPEARLPEGLDRGQLLSVLWRTGALRPGQVSVQLEETENKGAVPEIRAFCP